MTVFRPVVLFTLVVAALVIQPPSAWSQYPPQMVLKWGSSGTGDGLFAGPAGSAVDASGNLYVADWFNHRIQKFMPDSTFVTSWGSLGMPNGLFNRPFDVAVDGSGNVYVADSQNHRIQKFDSNGTFLLKWGKGGGDGSSGSGNGEFRTPHGVVVDGSGNVYVTDSDNHRIQKFDASGTFLLKWGKGGGDGTPGSGNGEFIAPYGIALDASGNIFVTEIGNSRVQKFDASETYLTHWGVFGITGADNEFSFPGAVDVDGGGYVYVVDSDNQNVQKFDNGGTFLAKWGSMCSLDTSSGCVDPDGAGPLESGDGQFYDPVGITVDSGSGAIYVSDTNNNRIQKFLGAQVPVLPVTWGGLKTKFD